MLKRFPLYLLAILTFFGASSLLAQTATPTATSTVTPSFYPGVNQENTQRKVLASVVGLAFAFPTPTPTPTGTLVATNTPTPVVGSVGQAQSVTLAVDMLSAGAFVTFSGNYKYVSYQVVGWSTAGSMFSAASTPVCNLGGALDCSNYVSNIISANVPNNTTGRSFQAMNTTNSIYLQNCAKLSFAGATPTTTAVATVIVKAQN